MKILLVADVEPNTNSGAAGTEYHTYQALMELGHEVDTIWSDDLPHKIKHGNFHYLLELPKGFRAAINNRCLKKEYDAIHVNQPHAYLAAKDHKFSNRPGVFVNRSHGIEVRLEEVLDEWRRKLDIKKRSFIKAAPGTVIDYLLARHQKLVADYADGHIVSCMNDHSFLKSRYNLPENRIACIHQATYNKFINTPIYNLNSTRLKHILHVGQFSLFKGLHTIAAVVNTLLAQDQNARFTWVTSDPDGAKELLTAETLSRTTFNTGIPSDEMIHIYDSHGIFLFPSLSEGFGKAFLEAMSRGLCVVTTKTGAMQDIISDAEDGYLCEIGDSDSMIEAINYLWNNPEAAFSVSRNARDKVSQYSWKRVAEETVDFYQRLLEMKGQKVLA